MGSKQGSPMYMMWIAVVLVLAVVFSFSAGYLVGTDTHKAKPFAIVDDYGRSVTLTGTPQRIVSVAPTPTEILFAVGAGGQVVGVDDYSDYPAEVANLTKVGSFTLNIETIVALKPDLIVASDLVPKQQLDQVEARGIPYVIFADRTLEDVFKTIRLAGIITGHVEQADNLATSLSNRVDNITGKLDGAKAEMPRVYVEYYPLWTYGPGSFGDDLIGLAGGINVAANTSSEYPEVTNEFVIAQDPEVIVYTSGVMSTTTKDSITSRPGWENITAVQTDSIYSIDDNLLSRYGPRVVDGLEELAAILHPALFP